jgi:hypothetical protein
MFYLMDASNTSEIALRQAVSCWGELVSRVRAQETLLSSRAHGGYGPVRCDSQGTVRGCRRARVTATAWDDLVPEFFYGLRFAASRGVYPPVAGWLEPLPSPREQQ